MQEIPQRAFRGKEVCASPILRVTSPDPLQFRKPVTIQLPLTVRGESSDVPDVSSCSVRILFQESASEEGKWTELTLDTPASCDGMVIKFSVKHFSKYVPFVAFLSGSGVIFRRFVQPFILFRIQNHRVEFSFSHRKGTYSKDDFLIVFFWTLFLADSP